MNTKTKVQWKTISNDIVSALNKIAKEHSVTFEVYCLRYSDSDCTV